ncbi:dual serine/threonine-protein kinase/phosphatase [gamma proteobacterium BDW918]|uniref:Protein kinase n=1 Tax=Zhongshania aliphaticivorans TaxID=1470434 RepID=A0A127M8L5_9GAMM|nr:bifunctional protein-serine/threonine kinase/phosphatase [Zhongshania aliphaticivorans]AMO69572.1 protein kinase [Zhongshania aliphaticivorans]EIF42227.1 dual serine/threonine-protein kinase/phosphatase [gamma proteobacterium BDW918]
MKAKLLKVSVGQCSAAGRKQVNQDFHGLLIPTDAQLSAKGIAVAIADGISSSQVSQVASETAVKTFLSDYYCTSDAWSVKTSALKVLAACNAWLYAQTQNSPYRLNKDKGYICTFSAVIFKSNTAYVFHCGDTRVYRVLGDSLELLTQDHRRVVSEEVSYLSRALGMQSRLEMDHLELPIEPGDTYVLATDGVYEYISDKAIAHAINTHEGDLDALAAQLLDEALKANSPDNLTMQIVRIEEVPDKQRDEVRQLLENLSPPPILSPRQNFEGYTIIRELHISSRSHVFLAADTLSGENVVIKTPAAETRDNREHLETMLLEDWIGRRIDSVNVLRSIAPHSSQRYIYTVTEFVDGKSLFQWMLDNPTPAINEVRGIVEQIANGLRALHRLEIVHQDLRPQNIMIDSAGTVKIIDFGAAKVAGLAETCRRNLGVVGTMQYSAPEYFLDFDGSSRSDIFSLGVIVYQMLCGELPYGNEVCRASTLQAQTRLAYKPLALVRADLPGWVDYAISQALQIQPEKRYQEVSEFVYDLQNPNSRYLNRAKPPIIERSPVLFWQVISAALLAVIVIQNIR